MGNYGTGVGPVPSLLLIETLETNPTPFLSLLAYNYACDVTVPTSTSLFKAGIAAASAITAVYGTMFNAGSGCKKPYPTSGESSDWHYIVAGAQYSYTVELRDRGTHGFVIPPGEILPSGVETFEGFKSVLQAVE